MKLINVNTSFSYSVHIERKLLNNCGKIIADTIKSRTVAIITDDIVDNLYYDTVEKTLINNGFSVFKFAFKNGEASKSSETLNNIYSFLCKNNITRSDCIIALGGGVVGDIAGYAAATYLRGIKYIQIPTTLLAQIDSSVGGKTAIDLPFGKNLVGAFKQPACVICDPDVLSTLSPEILSDGMAEAIKYGMIRDKKLFELISSHNINNVNEVIDEIIYKCISIKRDVVEADEFDIGERMILNFGHTIGHSVESFYHYDKYTHGSAVAIGMYMITEKSCDKKIITVLENCLKAYNLPYSCDASKSELVQLCGNDKKRESSDINFIICEQIGHAEIRRLSFADFKNYILN